MNPSLRSPPTIGGYTTVTSDPSLRRPMLARLTRVVGQQTDQYYLAKRWVPGLLTNWEKGRAHINKKISDS